MRRWKLCAATGAIAALTCTSSLLAAPSASSPTVGAVREVQPGPDTAFPFLAAVAAGGLVATFALGALQGYLEQQNEQQLGSTGPDDDERLTFPFVELEHVLD